MTTEIDNLVIKAWPTSPPEDAARLSKLTPEEERLVCVRLKALLEVEQGKRPASRAPEDDPRSIGSNGFQSLVRRWRKQRQVSTLLPYATRQPRKPKVTSETDEFETILETLLRKDPGMSLVTVSMQAIKASGSNIAINSARLRARAVRASIRSNEAWLKANYGKEILSDVCILGADLEGKSGVDTAVIALLVDAASGYIHGHAIGPIKESLDLQKAALADGLANVASRRLDRDDVGSVTLDCVIGVGTDEAVSSMSEKLRESGASVTVIDNPTRRCGDRANDVLDGAVDFLALRPRQGRQSRRFGNARWELERLIRAGAKAVEDHNAVREARIISAIGTARKNKGKILEALESVKNI
jgi:hypothetical protein